ncbi:uncharacterized protein J7T54_004101 [Emericellopsis cladophorae]|uniref:Uncharacterized protein n=1 Tax=Emericellopsis cladophorae TaxID=2686198 RepID=A0A9P9Y1A0_9HYPO|nr:uncharacterized protein J7T54_004101 [Emericellopsis cladophorae]KAI6781328.1 hypothetical protein J7T54_004101 [Emericellopsis cladophorae]
MSSTTETYQHEELALDDSQMRVEKMDYHCLTIEDEAMDGVVPGRPHRHGGGGTLVGYEHDDMSDRLTQVRKMIASRLCIRTRSRDAG